MNCYIGDTLSFMDLSSVQDATISEWDWQYFGHLGEYYAKHKNNIVNEQKFYLSEPGETIFYLCVKSSVKEKQGGIEPWSDNGNHQTVGKHSGFPQGMYWYFGAIRVVVHPKVEAKVNIRYWDAQNNVVFHENRQHIGELFNSETVDTTINITDWDGYQFSKWNVELPDGTTQYDGDSKDVNITLSNMLPEKTLNVEFWPIIDTQVRVLYWDVDVPRIMYEETVYGDKVVGDTETKIIVDIPDLAGYQFSRWSVMLADETYEQKGTDKKPVEIIMSSQTPFKYFNIGYKPININPPPTTTTPGTETPPAPSGICDGVITWTETDSHQRFDGYQPWGSERYVTCYHDYTYKTVLTANATLTPSTLKSGYGFEVAAHCSISSTALINHDGGCSSWDRYRQAEKTVSNPTKATSYIPWTFSNNLGAQAQAISMENHQTLKFRLPESNISSVKARKIYTDVALPGTAASPATHSFDIYISGGGVDGVEFCKKLTESITINGDMFEDDFTGMD